MSLNTANLIALAIAVGSGIAITLQTSLINLTGQTVGAVRAGFLVHLAGAIVGAVIVAALSLREQAVIPADQTGRLAVLFLLAGAMGMVILPGVAASFPRIGLVAGQVALIAGQLILSTVIDSLGLLGAQPIPMNWQRIVGLVLMAVAAVLLLPQSNG